MAGARLALTAAVDACLVYSGPSAKDRQGSQRTGLPFSLLCGCRNSWPLEPQLFSLLHVVTLEALLSPSKERLPLLLLCGISLTLVS